MKKAPELKIKGWLAVAAEGMLYVIATLFTFAIYGAILSLFAS